MGYLCPHPCWNQPATCGFSSCKILRPRERLLLFPKKPLSLLLFFYLHLFGFWGSPTWDNCCLDQMWRLLRAERRESRKTSMFFKEKQHFSIIIGLLLFSVSKLSFPFTRSRTNKIVWAVCSCFHSFHSFFSLWVRVLRFLERLETEECLISMGIPSTIIWTES